MPLAIPLVLQLKGSMDMAYGHVFPLSSLRKYAGKRGIHGEKWMSVGNDGTSNIVSLYSILYSYVLSG